MPSHSTSVFDVVTSAVVRNVWTGQRSADKPRWEHKALANAEGDKYNKHEEAYASLDKGFVALAVSVFGVLGDDFVRLLWSFACERA